MPMAMTGLSPNSPSIRYAGAHGYSPCSVFSSNSALIDHFDIFAQAAADAGRSGDRTKHRVVRDVFIADTDAEARKLALEGGMGRAWKELSPQMNDDPMAFDLDRKVRNHMAFGSGHHTCPGQFLARMEMKVLLKEWFARIPRFELEPSQTLRHRGGIVGGCEPFSLRWDIA